VTNELFFVRHNHEIQTNNTQCLKHSDLTMLANVVSTLFGGFDK